MRLLIASAACHRLQAYGETLHPLYNTHISHCTLMSGLQLAQHFGMMSMYLYVMHSLCGFPLSVQYLHKFYPPPPAPAPAPLTLTSPQVLCRTFYLMLLSSERILLMRNSVSTSFYCGHVQHIVLRHISAIERRNAMILLWTLLLLCAGLSIWRRCLLRNKQKCLHPPRWC